MAEGLMGKLRGLRESMGIGKKKEAPVTREMEQRHLEATQSVLKGEKKDRSIKRTALQEKHLPRIQAEATATKVHVDSLKQGAAGDQKKMIADLERRHAGYERLTKSLEGDVAETMHIIQENHAQIGRIEQRLAVLKIEQLTKTNQQLEIKIKALEEQHLPRVLRELQENQLQIVELKNRQTEMPEMAEYLPEVEADGERLKHLLKSLEKDAAQARLTMTKNAGEIAHAQEKLPATAVPERAGKVLSFKKKAPLIEEEDIEKAA